MRVPRWVLHTPARTHTPTHTRTPTHTHTRSSIARARWCRPALRRTNPVAWRLLRSFSVSAAAQVGPQRVGVACWTLHVGRCMLHVGHCMLHVGHFMLGVVCSLLHVARGTSHVACCRCLQMTIMSAVEGGKRTVRARRNRSYNGCSDRTRPRWLGDHILRHSPLAGRSRTRLGSPLPHLHRDRARPCHICTGTGR